MVEIGSNAAKRQLEADGALQRLPVLKKPSPVDQFCDGLVISAEVHLGKQTNCIEALRLVVRTLQQSDRRRDQIMAAIILSIAQGQTSVEDGKRELRTLGG